MFQGVRFEPVIRLPTAWTSVAERFGVHLFEGKLTVTDMNRMQSIGDDWFQRHPGRIVEMAVIYPSETRMTPEERNRMVKLIKHWEKHRVASATVILAGGLVGAMHRSVLTGLNMLAPPPHPMKVFSSTEDAVTWLMPHVQALSGPAFRRPALDEALATLVGAFTARANGA